MKTKLQTSIALMTAILFAGFSLTYAQTQITTWTELNDVRENLEGDFVLMNDLDENTAGYADFNGTEEGWLPIGTAGDRFMGTFDGGGYTISGLTIDRAVTHLGLFGYAQMATIKDLKVLDADIKTAAGNAAVLIGTAGVTTVENVVVSGNLNATGETTNLGGIIGRQEAGLVLNCASYVDINIEGRMVGGISGTMTAQAEIQQSYYNGNISTDTPSNMNRWIGGITGQFGGRSMITDAYVIGDITGTHIIGGLIGYHWRGGSTITNSYFVGMVEGNPEYAPQDEQEDPILNVGGITGFSNPPQETDDGESKAVNTFWNIEVSEIDISFGGGEYPTEDIGEGKTTAELKDEATFAEWDLEDVWVLDTEINDGYPALQNVLPLSSDKESEVVQSMVLNQNYPNPFNPTTVISFELPVEASVTIDIFNTYGQKIQTLVENQRRHAGVHEVTFDATNLSSGIYIYRLQAGNTVHTNKMTLIK